MLTLTTIAGVRARRRELDRVGRSVAFVPTMGALHEGHLSLIRRGRELADEVWASVFVNPTQFAPGEDFHRYPRDLERDRALLDHEGTSLLFAPTLKEMYPRPLATVVDLPELTNGLCGAFRPGHFRGVAGVVVKLLNIVRPEVAVLGAKDWQQATVVRHLVADLNLPVEIEVAPTVREADGLAMSSRNAYLTPAQRVAAAVVPRALQAGKVAVSSGLHEGLAVTNLLTAEVAREPLARLEYAAAVDPETLQPMARVSGPVLLALAVHLGSTRLIDNVLVELTP